MSAALGVLLGCGSDSGAADEGGTDGGTSSMSAGEAGSASTPTGGASSSATAGSGAADSGTASATATTSAGGACMVDDLLGPLGKDHMLVGAAMADETAAAAPFDLRYLYLSGGLFDGAAPCTDCASGCIAGGASCANDGPGCAWWGCWQYDQDPPGDYVRAFVDQAHSDGQIPMITYYQELQSSGLGEGADQLAALSDPAFLGRYLADFAFMLDQVGDAVAFVHVEPDMWGYGQQMGDPHAIPAAVSSAAPDVCGDLEDSFAGLGACMIAITRAHAPNARIGLHGSGWATNFDVLQNEDPGFDVVGHAQMLGDFLVACGADGSDFVVVDASDRDAAWYDTQGQDTWWDDTNATLPDFHQAFTWAGALAERVGRPVVWWQVPVGNMSLPNQSQAWQDNRVDYMFAHPDEVVAAHGAAIAFGAGDGEQTTPETDGGNLVAKVQAYADAGGQPSCVP